MKKQNSKMMLLALSVMAFNTGCSREVPPAEEPTKPSAPIWKSVAVGDSYTDVRKKLGKPNIESKTDTSLVLIYDKIEVKFTNDIVSAVFDHR